MKAALLLFAALIFSGCVSAPKKALNCDETCAIHDMVCIGQDMSSQSGTMSKQWRPGDSTESAFNPVTYNSDSESTTFRCARDESKVEKIKAIREQMAKKDGDNKNEALDQKCLGFFASGDDECVKYVREKYKN